MKIVQINSIVNSGSTGRIAEDIGTVAISRGYESFIAYGRGDRPSKSSLIKIGSTFDLYWHGLSSILFDNHGLASTYSTKKFIQKLKILNPDAIYLHNLHGYYLNYQVLFEHLVDLDIPIFWTLFDCWSFTGHCTYFDDIACNKWESQCHRCPKTKKYPSSYLMDNSKNNFLLKKNIFPSVRGLNLIVNSAWLKELVSRSFLANLPIYHIASGIDTAQFRPLEGINLKNKLQLPDKKIILGVASVWDKRKGLDDFIQLSSILEGTAQIVLIGLTKKQLSILPGSIIGIERTESINELVEYYNCADVFINPTHQDNFPTTNLEALACGIPVITYNTGGSAEAVDDKSGLIVTKGDLIGLKMAVEKILSVGKSNYTAFCRQRAIANYRKEDRFNDYLDLLSKQ
jgi:glycosyltransferase involved in cell wall biosynthesis